MTSVQVFCVANDRMILSRNLQRSKEISDGRIPLAIIWGAKAASVAYHDAMARAQADIVVFSHQDVYFPEGWFERLRIVCQKMSLSDPSWGVLGLTGVTSQGTYVGHLWDSGIGAVCGGPFREPREVASLDEAVLIVRRASGALFDPTLPSFHLYGTDIVLEAREAGMKSYVIDLPVIHNSKPTVCLDQTYVAAYRYMVRKWQVLLPWPTVIVQLTRNPLPLLLRRMRLRYKGTLRASTLHSAFEYPELKARELGFVLASEDAA